MLPLALDLLLTHGGPWADTALKLSLHGEAGEMICVFPPTNLTQCTLIVFSSTRAILAVGTDVSQACFALFLLQLQLFTPRILLSQFSYQSRLQNFKSTCIKLHRNVYKALFHHFLTFFPLAHCSFCNRKGMVLKVSPVRSYDELKVLLIIWLLMQQRGRAPPKSLCNTVSQNP